MKLQLELGPSRSLTSVDMYVRNVQSSLLTDIGIATQIITSRTRLTDLICSACLFLALLSLQGLDSDDDDAEGDETLEDQQDKASRAVQRKQATQTPASRTSKKQRVTDSPVSDTTEDEDEDDLDYDDEAPPQATLEDKSMEDESATERSFSRTPVRRSASHPALEEDEVSDEEPRRRKRSIAVPTPRVLPPRRDQRSMRQPSQSATSRAGSEPHHHKPLPQRLGLEPKKLAVMQASFFSKPRKDEQAAEKANMPSTQALQVRERPQLEAARPVQADIPPPVQEEQYLPQYKPLRTWQPIPLKESLVNGKEGKLLDAGLMLDRSFRACFGPQGQLVTLGRITPFGAPNQTAPQTVVNIVQPHVFAGNRSFERDRAAKTLQIQHSHTRIESNQDMLPLATTLPSLRFHHFVDGLQSPDTSHEATLWKLGNALFDEIDLGLPDSISDETIERVSRLRRKDAFSTWLREAVAPAVEQDLRRLAKAPADARGPATIFALLTGNQIERACQAALAEGDIRLATLLSQAGGDDEFRADINLQLAKWREYRVDPLIGKEYRKIYELLSGNVGTSPGIKGSSQVDTSEPILISEDLDWKRAFALRFWYAEFDNSISRALRRYDNDIRQDSQLAQPVPEYKLAKQPLEWSLPDDHSARDVIYEIIKLYSDVSKSLEDALSPRAASPSPFTYRQTWHLYQVLSRSLRVRQFEDVDSSGYSELSQSVIENYAAELEKLDLWEWAAFVLLHLADSDR